jgi:hypothetical protein
VTTNSVSRLLPVLAGAVILTLMWIVYGVDLYSARSLRLDVGGDVP